MTNVVVIPFGLDPTVAASVKAANAGSSFVTVAPAGEAAPPDIHRETALSWLDFLEAGALEVAGLVFPVKIVPFVVTALKVGIPALRTAILGEPTRERWTLEQMAAKRAALPTPIS